MTQFTASPADLKDTMDRVRTQIRIQQHEEMFEAMAFLRKVFADHINEKRGFSNNKVPRRINSAFQKILPRDGDSLLCHNLKTRKGIILRLHNFMLYVDTSEYPL